PGLAAVGGLVDAVAVRDGVARVRLAGADPDDVAVGGGDADGADGDGVLLVELVLEGDAVVDGLEQAAGGGGDEVGARVGLEAGDGGAAPALRGRADRRRLDRRGPLPGQAAGRRLGRFRRDRLVLGLAQLVELPLQLLELALDLGDLPFALGFRLIDLFR